MFKFLTRNKSQVKETAEEAFLKAESQLNNGANLVSVNENLELAYNGDTEILEKRFEVLNSSYNQLLRVEKIRGKKEALTNKVIARKKYNQNIPRKFKYKLSKVRVSLPLRVTFDKNNLDQYIAEAIHGTTSRNIINTEIQNEIVDIRMQMAQTENNLKLDKRQFETNLTIAEQISKPNYLSPAPVKPTSEILNDVFSELDSLINGEKAYIINGKASIIRSKQAAKAPNPLKKAINNIRV